MVTTIGQRWRSRPAGERAERAALVETLVDLAWRTDLDQLRRLRHGLARLPPPAVDPDAPTPAALAAARARNAARLLEERLLLERGSLPAEAVQRALGVSRQRLHQLRRDGRILGIVAPGRRGARYPAWQFGPDGRVLPGVEPIAAAAREAEMAPATLHAFMETPSDRLGGRAPAALLSVGEAAPVVDLLRSVGLGPF